MKKLKNKLQYDEQYGYWSYYADDNLIYELKEVEINGKKYKVVEVDNADIEYEMGHRSIVHSTKYHVKIPFEDTTVLVDLVQLINRKPNWLHREKTPRAKARVIATKFSLEPPAPAPTRARIK